MSSEMPNIDISGIEALREIKLEHDTVRSRLEKMIAMKNQVNAAVYEKVFHEYSVKLDEIADKAEPLKNRLRGQFRILRGMLERLSSELDTINLEREELTFRHTLGEFDDSFFEDETKKWEVKHASKQVEREEAESVREAFLSVFDGQEDLDGDVELSTIPVQKMVAAHVPRAASTLPAAPVEPETPELPEVEDSEPDLGIGDYLDSTDEQIASAAEEMIDEISPEDAAETVASGEIQLMADLPEDLDADLGISPLVAEELDEDDLVDDLDDFSGDLSDDIDSALEEDDMVDELDDDTGELPPLHMDESTRQGDEVAMPPLPQDRETVMLDTLPMLGGGGGEGETMIIATPKLISMNNATEGQTIVLGMGTTSLGRSPDNDIHVTEDRISRKHCQVTFGPGGYALYDLNSENGSFVNGQRIREHFLQDGDIVQVGTYKYLYRDH